jgi:hypothetical protein
VSAYRAVSASQSSDGTMINVLRYSHRNTKGATLTKRISPVAVGATLLAIMASPITGHHSFSGEFDLTKPTHIEGKVTKVEWGNPHVVVRVTGTDSRGSTVEWKVQTSQPDVLPLLGWNKGTVTPGMDVRVGGYPAKKAGDNTIGSTVFTITATKLVFKTPVCWNRTNSVTLANLADLQYPHCGVPEVP